MYWIWVCLLQIEITVMLQSLMDYYAMYLLSYCWKYMLSLWDVIHVVFAAQVKHDDDRKRLQQLVVGNVYDRLPALDLMASFSFCLLAASVHMGLPWSVSWRARFDDTVPVTSSHKKQSYFLEFISKSTCSSRQVVHMSDCSRQCWTCFFGDAGSDGF